MNTCCNRSINVRKGRCMIGMKYRSDVIRAKKLRRMGQEIGSKDINVIAILTAILKRKLISKPKSIGGVG